MIRFVTTADGSKTLFHPQVGEHYHSRHGALQESRHVFLSMGLERWCTLQPEQQSVSVLEVGFGTGLNFLLTADHCCKHNISLHYTGVEAYPLPEETIVQTDYGQYVNPGVWEAFLSHYKKSQDSPQPVSDKCVLEISVTDIMGFEPARSFDIVYFDAFAAVHQPHMWTPQTLEHVTRFLRPGGIFVTYAITGQLKRTLKALGFATEKVPGAPGKREMLRAVKAN